MEVVILSDTHVMSRAPELPAWVRRAVAGADHVVHAGDFDSRPAYETVADLAAELTAVHGNTDGDYGLAEVATADVGGVRFVVTHGTGPDAGYEERVAAPSSTSTPPPTGRRSASPATPTASWTPRSTATGC